MQIDEKSRLKTRVKTQESRVNFSQAASSADQDESLLVMSEHLKRILQGIEPKSGCREGTSQAARQAGNTRQSTMSDNSRLDFGE